MREETWNKIIEWLNWIMLGVLIALTSYIYGLRHVNTLEACQNLVRTMGCNLGEIGKQSINYLNISG